MERLSGWLNAPGFWRYVVGPLVLAYGLYVYLSGRMNLEHSVLLGAMTALNYTPRTHAPFRYLFPFFLFWIIYDWLRVLTPIFHGLNPPRVAGPYLLELELFGVEGAGGALVTAPEYFAQHTHVVLDLAAAFGYAFYFYEPFLVAFYLLAKDRPRLVRYAWAFFAVNMLGFITYYVYPAAPPWYVELYGFGPARLDVPSNPARLVAVDELLGIGYFQALYAKAANVFGALPSLHAAYPLIVWLYLRDRVRWPASVLLLGYWILVCFSAVYLQHHYIIDVALGVSYALATYAAMEWSMAWWARRRRLQHAQSGLGSPTRVVEAG